MNVLVDAMRSLGRADAADLRKRAQSMDGTAIIAEEGKVPAFEAGKDYSQWPVGAPVRDDGQCWTLLQPYNSAHHPGKPATLRALWGLAHTKDPTRAKPWVEPLGTSGMYMKDECYMHTDGKPRRCLANNTVHDADAAPQLWEVVQ